MFKQINSLYTLVSTMINYEFSIRKCTDIRLRERGEEERGGREEDGERGGERKRG